jgi:hypothetical protein
MLRRRSRPLPKNDKGEGIPPGRGRIRRIEWQSGAVNEALAVLERCRSRDP